MAMSEFPVLLQQDNVDCGPACRGDFVFFCRMRKLKGRLPKAIIFWTFTFYRWSDGGCSKIRISVRADIFVFVGKDLRCILIAGNQVKKEKDVFMLLLLGKIN